MPTRVSLPPCFPYIQVPQQLQQWGCSAGSVRLFEPILERVKKKRELNKAQNKLKGRSLFLSLASYSDFFFHPTPPNPPSPPSVYLFLLHPTHPACSNLWQMTVGWHQNGATGRETAYTPHGSDKQRETPSDFLLCCSSAPIHFSWCANAVCVCSVGLKAKSWLFKTLVYPFNGCSVNC